jgi:hypothetical protein
MNELEHKWDKYTPNTKITFVFKIGFAKIKELFQKMKKLFLIIFLFSGLNSFSQGNMIDSLYKILTPDIETVVFCHDLKELKVNINTTILNIDLRPGEWTGKNPTYDLRLLNEAVNKFNTKYAGQVFKGVKIPILKTYKLVLIQDD